METQKMSDYHRATSIVNKALKDQDLPLDALAQMEHHGREMLELLHELVDTGSLDRPSSIAIDALQELGLLDVSQSSRNHIQFLTDALTRLSNPTNPQIFYSEFNHITPMVFAHDRAATTLADQVRLYTLGLLNPEDLTLAYKTFTKDTEGITHGP